MNQEDHFEQRLRRQPARPIPSTWREEIIAAAESVRGSHCASRPAHLPLFSTLKQQFAVLFLPHSKAWAGLAAVWAVIITLQIASRDRTQVFAQQMPPPSPEVLMVLRQQKLLLAELVERPEPRTAVRPRTIPPQPRSERHSELSIG